MTPPGAGREPGGARETSGAGETDAPPVTGVALETDAARMTDAWVKPTGVPAPGAWEHLRAGDLPIRYPTRDAVDPDALIAALRDAGRGLAAIPTAEMVRILGGAAEAMTRELDRADLQDIAANGRISAAMARAVVAGMATSWTTAAIDQLVRAEFPDPHVLDGFVAETGGRERAVGKAETGVREGAGEPRRPARAADAAAPRRHVRAAGPPVTVHFGAGSVPGVTVTSMIRALLVRSAVLVKPGAGDIALTVRFARLLHRADPRLARAVAVQYWPGGAPAWDGWERDLLRAADQVVVYGGDAAIEAVRARAPATTRLIEHPHRIGVAIIGPGAAPGTAGATESAAVPSAPPDSGPAHPAEATARAAALFEQRGCVSTHLVLIVGSEGAARTFCTKLAASLSALETRLPPAPLTPGELSARHQLRGHLAMKGAAVWPAITGESARRSSAESTRRPSVGHRPATTGGWSVILSPPGDFEPAGARTVWVAPVSSLAECPDALAPLSPVLQTIGLAGIGHERAAALAEDLFALGATRIVPLDQMPFPDPDWLHDGARPLRELVRWGELRSRPWINPASHRGR